MQVSRAGGQAAPPSVAPPAPVPDWPVWVLEEQTGMRIFWGFGRELKKKLG